MLLGFKRQFAPFVLDGSKTHTIRAHRKNAPRVGEVCHCYTNVRQKDMTLLGRWPCVRVEPITLDFEPDGIAYRLRITLGDVTLTEKEAERFALADGFRNAPRDRAYPRSIDRMARFWIADGRLKDAIESPAWHGVVIHWKFTDQRGAALKQAVEYSRKTAGKSGA